MAMKTRNLLRLIWPLLYVLLLVGKSPAQGTEAKWELILPHRIIWSLAVDASTPGIIYAGGTAVCPDTCSDNLFKSVDGGDNWTTLGLFFSEVFAIAIDPDSSNIIYLVVFIGTTSETGLMQTTDGGESWELWDLNYYFTNTLDADITIDINDPNIVYVPLLDGIAKSTDRGKSWTRLVTGYFGQWSLRVQPDDSRVLYLATWENGVLKSEDGGESWRVTGLDSQWVSALEIDPNNHNILYAATSDEGIYKSVDYGENWMQVNNGLTDLFFKNLAIDPLNTDVIYAARSGALFRSSNGGADWSEINAEGIGMWAFTLDPTNPEILYAGGVGGVHKLDISTLVAVAEENGAAPQTFSLAQNYPNPFNPSTSIEFSLPKSEYVELKVYNILGKEVSTLVSKKLNQGNHNYQFDGKDLASGIYYYQLVAGEFQDVKKMILLK